jgi:hypothetical protein
MVAGLVEVASGVVRLGEAVMGSGLLVLVADLAG